MKDWKNTLISPNTPVFEALKVIATGSLRIALVVDEDMKLLGTVTDGDVRTLLLRNGALDTPVSEIMSRNPMFAAEDEDRESIALRMTQRDILHLPVVNARGQLVGMHVLKDLVAPPRRDNLVVLMAGGLGTRLRPLTDSCPKPMLCVGGRPILETIIRTFQKHGYNNFVISLNYMPEKIQEYFKDGSQLNASITYVHEHTRLGTAGALSLLPQRPELPFFVMNGDLLTKVNFNQLMEFHMEKAAPATMCVREYDMQVPFGVVSTSGNDLLSIDEKPLHKFFVNAGIYVLSPVALDYIPQNTMFDMPDLYKVLLADNLVPTCFPIREYWMDIGRMEDFARAEMEYHVQFSSGND
jgi:dTDP-glucose pyrophosphorylase